MAAENNTIILRQDKDGKRTYSVGEIAEILQISKSKAYALCREAPFKTVKVGKYVRISKASFDAWLDSAE